MAEFVAKHYLENVEPLGYKAFLVGVDREACAHYKHALDQFLPPEYSEVVYTGSNNDAKLLKEFHLDPKRERQIRKSFGKLDQQPKILIVTEKLLTGFDAPLLYAMYLDKPMRDHTLLQAIARVNRPYENEAQEMVKPHGFVLDFVGIFDKLEKALAFDSDEINAIIKDLKLLKVLFKNKMESKAPDYLGLIERNFNDKDVDTLIEHFRDPERRKEFFKEYKEIEMLYESRRIARSAKACCVPRLTACRMPMGRYCLSPAASIWPTTPRWKAGAQRQDGNQNIRIAKKANPRSQPSPPASPSSHSAARRRSPCRAGRRTCRRRSAGRPCPSH